MLKRQKLSTKLLLSYTMTFIVIQIADSASMVIDGLVVSRNLSPTLLAATGLAAASFQIFALFCGLFAVGIQSRCSAAMGAGDQEKNNLCFSCGCIIAAVIAVLATIGGYLCLDPLCVLLGADGSDAVLYQGLRDYLKGWFFGVPGFIGFTVFSPLVTLDGNKKCVTIATIVQSGVNILGDYLAVKILHWDCLGVGLATGLGFNLSFLVLLTDFFRKRSSFRFSFVRVQFSVIREFVHVGLPRLTKYFCKLLAPLLVNRTVIAVGGATAMAVMSVKSSICGFCLVVGNGIAESVNLLTQVFYSERDKQALRRITKTAALACAVFCSLAAALLLIFSKTIAGIYLPAGSEEYVLAVRMVRCLALSVPVNALNSCIMSYLQGARKLIPAHLHTVSHRLFFLALSTLVLGKIFGINGLFAALPVCEVLVLATYVIAAMLSGQGLTWQDSLLLLPADFGCAEENMLSVELHTFQDVVGISEQVNAFCLARGIDEKRAYYAALCIEELAGNVIGHGFTEDNKRHECEVRVIIEDGDITLRIRDDCRYFNMKEHYKTMRQGDEFSNIGIRLVYQLAKEIHYVNLLNTNTLILRI